MRDLHVHLQELYGADEVVVVIYGDNFALRGNIGDAASSWGENLKPRLAELFHSKISMLNTSKENNTFQYGFRSLQEDILSFRPDITFIMLGTLDAYASGFLDTTIKKDLDRFFTQLEDVSGTVIVITSPGLNFFTDENDIRKERLDEYNELLRDAAQYYRFPVFNLAFETERLLASDPEKYRSLFSGPDRLSPIGNEYVATYIYQKLKHTLGEKHDD